MQSDAKTVDQYILELPEERKGAIIALREIIIKNLPKGFEETMSYGMIGYVIPHSIYPKGYHCDPKLPLPFINVASQKNFIAIYHMGIYADDELKLWFENEFPKYSNIKLEKGKSCMRFKKINQIPIQFIGLLVSKMKVEDWIALYELKIRR